MTGNRSTTSGHCRRQIGLTPATFAGAATVAAFALFTAMQPGATDTIAASGPAIAAAGGFAADGPSDDNGESGDIFQQNAQSQGSP